MSDSKDRRNYEDLKAKLGLKKAKAEAEASGTPLSDAGAGEPVGEPSGSRTPAGGFDLGLERGGGRMDSSLIDVEKAAAQIGASDSDGLSVKMSGGMKALVVALLLAAVAAAAGLGWVSADARAKRLIEDQQVEDAKTLLAAVETAQALPRPDSKDKPEPLAGFVRNHADLIGDTAKALLTREMMDDLALAHQQPGYRMSEGLMKAGVTQLQVLAKACDVYASRHALFEPSSVLGDSVFNGAAVKAVIAYGDSLRKLSDASRQFADERVVFAEFAMGAPGKYAAHPSLQRVYRVWEAPKGGHLLPVSFALSKNGKRRYKTVEDPIEPGKPQYRVWVTYGPALFRDYGPSLIDKLVDRREPKEWLKCENRLDPESKGEEGSKDKKKKKAPPPPMSCEHLAVASVIVDRDFKNDVAEPVEMLVGDRDVYYKHRLLQRLLLRLRKLNELAKPHQSAKPGSKSNTMHEIVIGKLRKAAKKD